jgi:hypothetical protein
MRAMSPKRASERPGEIDPGPAQRDLEPENLERTGLPGQFRDL